MLIGLAGVAASLPPFFASYFGEELAISDSIVYLILTGVMLAVFVPLGIGFLIIGFATLKGKRWAWMANMILSIISIPLSIGSGVSGDPAFVAGLIIDGIVIAFLLTKPVKVFLGRIQPTSPPTPPTNDKHSV